MFKIEELYISHHCQFQITILSIILDRVVYNILLFYISYSFLYLFFFRVSTSKQGKFPSLLNSFIVF